MHALQYFSLLAAASAVLAQEDALAGLVTALESLGLNGLAGAAAAVNGTDQGLAILQALTSGGNYTIFAPSNEACTFLTPCVLLFPSSQYFRI